MILNPLQFTIAQFQLFILVLLRITGVVIASPLFSARVIPVPAKAAFIIVLTLTLFGFVRQPAAFVMPDATLSYLFYGARELLLGLLMGFVVSLIFVAAQVAGEIIDMQLGFGVANVINPLLGTQNAVLGQFYFLIATLFFLGINGHLQIIRSLALSFDMIPVGSVQFNPEGIQGVLETMMYHVFASAIKVAAPVMVVILLSNISVGLLGRSVMNMNLLVVQFPLYIVVGLLMVAGSLGLYCSLTDSLISDSWVALEDLIAQARG